MLILERWQLRVAQSVKLEDSKFAIPVETITSVTNRIDTSGPKTSHVIAFGVLGLASKRHEEYVSIATETPTRVETFLFRVDKDMSDTIVAKIEFAAKKARELIASSGIPKP